MSFSTGEIIADVRDPQVRFRVVRYLRQSTSADLVLGESVATGEMVVMRAPRHDDAWTVAQIRERRALADLEMFASEAVSPYVPMPVALVHVDNPELTARDASLRDSEPIVVHRFVPGTSLPAWMAANAPNGLTPELGLRMARVVAAAMHAVHEHGFVMRGLRPDHIIVSDNLEVHVVGFSRAGKKTERVSPLRPYHDESYSAPEIARELSGKFVTPRADIYSFGAVLAYIFTGEPPTGNPNAPFTRTAQQRIAALPEGIGLIIAHCMQPLHKKRFASLERLIPMLELDSLPGPTTADFGTVALIDTFGRRGDAFGPVGHLTAGPLVSRPHDALPASPDASGQIADFSHESPFLHAQYTRGAARWVAYAGIALLVLFAIARIAAAARG
jgi:serine/threonine protein kinase